MNGTNQNFFETLEQKLVDAGIPAEIAKRYARLYSKGLRSDIAFEKGELPPDENFRTLAEMYENFYAKKNKPISEIAIKSFLSVPYSRIISAQKVISELFPNHSHDVAWLYKEDLQIYYLQPEEVTYLHDLISEYISEDEKLWQIFKVCVKAGVFYTESRFEAVVDAVGENLAPEVIYQSTVNGYLLHPHYNDPIEALKFLRKQFDEQTTAKIIVENPDYLYLYKDEYYIEFPNQKQERENKINNIIAKYKH